MSRSHAKSHKPGLISTVAGFAYKTGLLFDIQGGLVLATGIQKKNPVDEMMGGTFIAMGIDQGVRYISSFIPKVTSGWLSAAVETFKRAYKFANETGLTYLAGAALFTGVGAVTGNKDLLGVGAGTALFGGYRAIKYFTRPKDGPPGGGGKHSSPAPQ